MYLFLKIFLNNYYKFVNLRDTKLLILFKNLKKKIQSYKAQNKN